MFRQWLRDWLTDWSCRELGHHWWVEAGTTAQPEEDGTLGVYGTWKYGTCKRCGEVHPDQEWKNWKTHVVRTTDVSMVYEDGTTNITVEHEVEVIE